MSKVTIDLGDRTVSYDDSPIMARKVFDAVIEWYRNHDQFSGEGIMQMDSP